MVAQQEQRAAHDPTKGRPCATAPAVLPRPAWLTWSQPTGERLTYLRAVPIVFDDRQRSSLTAAPRVDKSSGPSACVGSSRANPMENETTIPRPPGSPSENPHGKHACRGLSLIWTLVFLLAMGGLVGQHFCCGVNWGIFTLP